MNGLISLETMIERTFDYRRVIRLVPWMPVVSSKFFYLIETVDGEDLGVWTLREFWDALLIHADMSPKCRGKDAVVSMRNAFKWIFENTRFKEIFAKTQKKTPACFMAVWSGMKFMHIENNERFYKVKKDVISC